MTDVGTDWPTVRLGDVVEVKYGKALPRAKRRDGAVPVLGSNGIVGSHDAALTSGPSIIVGRKGSSGAINFSPVPCWPIDTAYYIDDPGPYSIRFLDRLLRTLGLEHIDRSTAIPGLNREQLYDISIPLPDIYDQRAIVDVVDSVEEKRVNAASHLGRSQRVVKRFRQAVLSSACSGRLTDDWRGAGDGAVSSNLVVSVGLHHEGAANLPPSWVAAPLGDVGTVEVGGTPSRKKPEYWNGGIQWVSSGEVANCRIGSSRETISQAGLDNSSAKLYPAGTVLIAMIGEGKTRGQAAILDIEACTNQNAAGIMASPQCLAPEYLWRWALAQYEITRGAGRGGNQPALNKQRVRELVIPIPPLDEQTEIVKRVDALLHLSDGVATKLGLVSMRLDRTARAALAKAFRGEFGRTPNEAS